MGQTSFPPEGILVSAAGVIGATASGNCANLTAAQLRSFASVYSQAEIAAAFQPLDATLTALAGVSTAANKLIYATGSDTFSTTDFSSYGRSLVDDADAATARTTLGLGTMATQAASSYLALTGGTLAGTLNGVAANFSGVVSAGGGTFILKSVAGAEYGRLTNNSGVLSINVSATGYPVQFYSPGSGGFRSTNDSGAHEFASLSATEIGIYQAVVNVPGYGALSALRIGSLSAASGAFSSGVSVGPATFAVLNATTASVTAGVRRVTDRGNRLAYPDGTNWRWVGDDSIIL